MDAKTLIDKAKAGVLTDQQLADQLKVKREYLSQWRHGTPCPMWAQIKMAEIAGIDPRPLALEKVMRSEKDPERREAIRKALQLGGAEISYLASTALALTVATVTGDILAGLATMYRKVKSQTVLFHGREEPGLTPN